MKKKRSGYLFWGTAAFAAAVAFSGCGSNAKLNVMDFVQVKFTGINGEGKVEINFDEEAALASIAAESKQGLSENDKTSIRNILSIAERDIAVSSESGLKNGDGITVTTKLDGSTLKEYKTAIANSSKKFDVSGLVDGVTLDLTDYVTFSYSGFDGHGTAYPGFDWDAYNKALNEQVQAVAGSDTGSLSSVIAQAQNAPSLSSGNYIDLSNGDTVTTTVSAMPSQFDSIGIILEGGEKSETVSGLEEPQEIDLSDYVQAAFSGICPNLNVSYTVSDDFSMAYYIYRPESRELFLNNGDSVEETISCEKSDLLRNGYNVTNDEVVFTVSERPSYLVDYSQETAQETVRALAEEKTEAGAFSGNVDVAETYLEDYSQGDWQNADIQLAGIYGYTADIEGAEAADFEYPVYNKLYLVTLTSIPVQSGDGTSAGKNVWTVHSIGKLVQKPDGSLYDPAETVTDEYGNNMENQDYDASGEPVNYRTWDAYSFDTREEAMDAIEADAAEILGNDAVLTVIQENEVQEKEGETAGTAHVLPEIQEARAAEVDPVLISQAAAGPVVLDGHTYLAFHEVNGSLLGWKQAKEFCEKNGGHLVTVNSIQEQAVLNYLRDAADRSIRYWIGLSDLEHESVFTWVTGEPVDFTWWDSGQPDNYSGSDEKGEDVIEAFYGSSGKWNDLPSGDKDDGFMMEIEPAEEAAFDAENLTDKTPSYIRESEIEWYCMDSFGDPHFYPMGMDARDRARLDYILDGRYSLLNFSLSIEQDASSDAAVELKIWGDGRLLYDLSDFRKTSVPKDVSLDVTGVGKLSIQTRSDSGYALVLLGEGKLILADEPVPVQASAWLEDTDNMTFVNADATNPMPRDLYGRKWRDMYEMYNNAETSWNLAGKYTRFQAVIAPAEDYDSRPADVSIYGDGTLLYEKKGYTSKEGAVLIGADVTGVRVLTIRNTSPMEDGRSQEIALCDTLLTGEAPAEEETASAADTEEYVFPELDEKYAAAVAGTITCGDVRYYLIEDAVNQPRAASAAEEMGGTLAVPQTEEQRYAIAKLLSRFGNEWHRLGAFYEKGKNGWVLPDHTPIRMTDWLGGQLPEIDEEYPFLIERGDGDFGRAESAEPLGYVVQVQAISGPAAQETSDLSDFEWNARGGTYDTDYVLPDGSYCLHALGMEFYDYTSVSVELEGDFAAFSGKLICDQMSAGQTASYAIFGDGKLLFEKNNFRKQDLEEPVPFQVDVTGVKTLSIEAKRILVDDTMRLITADIRLLPSESRSLSGVTRLQNMDTVDKSNTDIYPNELFRDRRGVLHEGGIRMNSGSAYLFYNLNKKYTSLSLTFTAGANTNQYEQVIQILADDQVVWEETFQAASENLTAELDMTGVRVLQIRKDTAPDAGGGSALYLEDDFLK